MVKSKLLSCIFIYKPLNNQPCEFYSGKTQIMMEPLIYMKSYFALYWLCELPHAVPFLYLYEIWFYFKKTLIFRV